MSQRVIALVSDAYGGRGGIAVYNRDLLSAICSHPDVGEVVALPRCISYALEAMPANLRFKTESAGSKLQYAKSVLKLAASANSADLIVCGHLHLLPFAHFLAWRFGCRVLPVTYGIEAWRPTTHGSVNWLCRRIDAFISIRKLTADKLKEWAHIPEAKFHYLPNCVDLHAFGDAPKRADLLTKFGLNGRVVVMTAGRLDTDDFERNKGFDEVLESLPLLAADVPSISYLIMGDGPDRARLEHKAQALGVADRVAFTGYVANSEKADHYRLADAVAMPGSNPTFDRYPYRFAFLEPLACGVPVVGARLETPSERDDPDARQLIIQVDPNDPADIKRGILEALPRRGRSVDPLLAKFSYEAFAAKAHAILSDVLPRTGTGR